MAAKQGTTEEIEYVSLFFIANGGKELCFFVQRTRRLNDTETENDNNIQAWKRKTEKAKKSEILKELNKLRVQIVALDREKSTHLYSKRNDFRQDFLPLQEMETKATESRKTEQIKLKQQLEKISHMVKRFHTELKDVKPTPEFVEKLKIIMEEIESTINAFKEQQRRQYEELMREERTTTQEILALEKKFEAWSQMGDDLPSARKAAPTPTAPLASARDITKDLPPEVAAFEKFLEQTGGVRGGWDEYDHQTFLKFRHRNKGRPAFLQQCLIAIPTRTEEEITNHEDWYQTYLDMNESKKESIRKWKERKQREKDDLVSLADDNLNNKKKREEEKQQAMKEKIENEKMERFSKLNAWKVQKEIERAEAEEKILRQQLENSKKKDDFKKKQTEMKAQVEEYRKKREEEEEFVRIQQEEWEKEQKERQKQISAREITRFRQRDKKSLVEKLKKKDQLKDEEKREKEKRLAKLKSQVEIEVDRDPNRLLQPTAGWKSRTKEIGPSGSGQVIHMQHRAIPSWRQGLH
ncbi:LOW QUALITY PROTEIN: coiled-coil domain-containing protein 112-like [Argopecten irradians]|uniref:LOW QUALITY PROTEIN: coiled-coil domain-containing protein 112-like n=1 Tax=Argopecten irradians TaxID=31199 RepID=UPI00371B4877